MILKSNFITLTNLYVENYILRADASFGPLSLGEKNLPTHVYE